MQANRSPKKKRKGTINNNNVKNRFIHMNVKMHDYNTNQWLIVQRLLAGQDT